MLKRILLLCDFHGCICCLFLKCPAPLALKFRFSAVVFCAQTKANQRLDFTVPVLAILRFKQIKG